VWIFPASFFSFLFPRFLVANTEEIEKSLGWIKLGNVQGE